jgi:cell division protein FtsN
MAATSNKTQRGAQRGGFALGVVVGLLVGLALALGVALYVTKVPVPFVDKVPQRTAEQDAAEAEKNRHWDPNAPLASKAGPPRPAASGPDAAASTPAASVPGGGPSRAAEPLPVAPAASFARIPPAPAAASAAASAVSAKPGAEAFVYYVQVAAFTRADEAEQLRARLALNGLMARVTEREQNGRTMHRVRLGPYDLREDAERVKTQALDVGYAESTLVRVNR